MECGESDSSDQVAWGTGSGLQYWNENILREALEKASAQTSGRSDFEQKIGDYWQACSDEPALEAAGSRDLKPGWDRQDEEQVGTGEQVAQIHLTIPGAWSGNDNQTGAALLGFGSRAATTMPAKWWRASTRVGWHCPTATSI